MRRRSSTRTRRASFAGPAPRHGTSCCGAPGRSRSGSGRSASTMSGSSSRSPGSACSTTRAVRNGRRGSPAARSRSPATASTAGRSGPRTRPPRSGSARTARGARSRSPSSRATSRGSRRSSSRSASSAGDRVAIFLPMSPEVAVASHAIAHIGAIQVPIFSGFAATAVAQRLEASEAKVVITQELSSRRGKAIPMREIVDEAGVDVQVVLAPFALDEQPGVLPALGGRQRAPVPPHVHVGHDRSAEGRRPRAGRLPRLDRARGVLPGGRPPGRRDALRHRHGLDHGPVDARRRRRARGHGRLRGGCAGLAGSAPALAHRRAGGRDVARPVADARARAAAARRTGERPLVVCGHS